MPITLSNQAQELISFSEYLETHEKSIHENKLLHISDYMENALDLLNNGSKTYGDPMPWNKTQDKFRFRPSEVTIWAGANGSGKSLVMGQCALTLSQISPLAIASFEMPPVSTVARMLRQCSGETGTTIEYSKRLNEALNLHVYDHIGSLDTNTVFGMIHYMAVEKGIKHVMIDSMVKCGVDSERNEPQKNFISKLQDIAKEHKIHIHLVHHTRKTQNETDIQDKYSVKGAGEIVDLTDNLIIVQRNKKKEFELMNNKSLDTIEYHEANPDCFLTVSKQRHGDFEGRFAFWFDKDSTQWCEFPDKRKMVFVK